METSSVMMIICASIAIMSIIISGVSLFLAFLAWSTVVGFKNSTHQIQYVPLENEKGEPIEGKNLDKAMKEALVDPYDTAPYFMQE